jgi:hypothetical protein
LLTERLLAVLVDRLGQTFGDVLVSVILYGSAASDDYHGRYSDLNVFCVLTEVTPGELAKSEPIFRWWRDLGNPAPLLMTEHETRRAADSFAIEFSDMRERRKVLYGQDVIAGISVDPRYWRAQLEHELRSALLRLRQQAAGVLSDRDALLKLCLDSVSTFFVLGRHALLIRSEPCGTAKRSIAERLREVLGEAVAPFIVLLDIREERTPPQDVEPATLFGKYLTAVEQLIEYVDRIG